MRALKDPLVLTLSLAVLSTIGFAGCGSSSKSNNDGGTGGGSAAGGSTGSGGSASGGNTGSGGHVDAGSDVRTGAGGSGADSGSSPMCTALLACCNSATAAQAALKAQCLTAYNMALPMGDGACGTVLSTIKSNGLCN